MKAVHSTRCFRVMLVLLSGVLSPAATLVVFDTFNGGSHYSVSSWQDVTCGQFNGDWYRAFFAMAFVPDKTVSLDTVELGLTLYAGYNNADVLLMSDDSGLPGGTLESMRLSGVIPAYQHQLEPLVKATSVLKPLLEAGKQYWIAVGPGPNEYVSLYWHHTLTGYNGSAATGYTRNGTRLPWNGRLSGCSLRVVGSFSGCARPRSDLNGDCKVDLLDLAILASDWLAGGFENPDDC